MSRRKSQENRKNPRRRKKPEERIEERLNAETKPSDDKNAFTAAAAPIGSVVHLVASDDDTPIDEREEAPGLPMEEEPEEEVKASDEESEDEADSEDEDEEDDEADDAEESDENEDEGSMSLIRHLEELRTRIIKALLAVAVGSGISYFYIEEIMHYITMPSGKLYYLQPAEAFFTYLKIAFFAGFLLALPVIFYQIWRFVLPALTVREKTVIALLVPTSVVLFFSGLAFSFFLVLPAAMQFFVGFSTEDLQPMFSLNQYFSFVISFILPFGAVFELPLIVVVMAKMGFISSEFLKKKQRIVLFLAFVVGAIVSPTPDIFTQSMIAIPLFLLYEISYLIVRFILHK
jgi:sec-independent protein translocase protein TatC